MGARRSAHARPRRRRRDCRAAGLGGAADQDADAGSGGARRTDGHRNGALRRAAEIRASEGSGRRLRRNTRARLRAAGLRRGYAIPFLNAARSAWLTVVCTTAGLLPPLAARSAPSPRDPPDAETCAV